MKLSAFKMAGHHMRDCCLSSQPNLTFQSISLAFPEPQGWLLVVPESEQNTDQTLIGMKEVGVNLEKPPST